MPLYAPVGPERTKWNKVGTSWHTSSELFAVLCDKQADMHKWIIIMSLIAATAATAAICVVYYCCRRIRRERELGIVYVLHEQDRLARELERIRVEKRLCRRLLDTDPPDDSAAGQTLRPTAATPPGKTPQPNL